MIATDCRATGAGPGVRLTLLCLLGMASLALAPPAGAARPVRVYEVDASGDSGAALQEALRQVLVRATGRRESARDPALEGIVQDAPRYLKSTIPGAHGELHVVFDGTALERAIAGAGRAVWDKQRPFTLVTLYPPLNRAAEAAARAELERAAAERGLLINLVPLTVVDAGGAPLKSDELLQTGQRYGADQVLIGRADGAPDGQWRWTLYTNFASPSWTGPLAAGIDGTVDLLAPTAGSGSLADAEQDARVTIENVAGLADYASVERILSSLPGVRRAYLAEAEGSRVVFHLTVRGGSAALERSLGAPSHLMPAAGEGPGVYRYQP